MATWVGYPRSYTAGRQRPVQYVVIHCTAGNENLSAAEDGAHYDKIRTDGTSTHIFVDPNSAVREVPDRDRAHHARHYGNEIGLGVELCGGAAQTALQWHDGASTAELRLAAKEVAQMCYDHGLPAVHLSVAQTRAAYFGPPGERPFGICGHYDVTRAYPEDQGDHTDPGPNFPWSEFLTMVQAELDALGGDDMALKDDVDFWYLMHRIKGIEDMADPIVIPDHAPSGKAGRSEPNLIAQAIRAAAGELPPTDLEAIKAAAFDGGHEGGEAGGMAGAKAGLAGATIQPAA